MPLALKFKDIVITLGFSDCAHNPSTRKKLKSHRIDLSQLISRGLISTVGKARLTKYRLNPEIKRETLTNKHPDGGAGA